MGGEESSDDRKQCPGDRAAREEFVRASYTVLFRWFCRLSGSSDRAADLTQETFAAFWGSLERIPGNVSPRTWLYAIGRNLWRKQLRRRKTQEPIVPELALAADDPPPAQSAEEREFLEMAGRAVRALPDDLREAFTLRFWDEFGYEEIGEIQGVSAGLARWRYFAARRRLHEMLAAWDPDQERAGEDQHAR